MRLYLLFFLLFFCLTPFFSFGQNEAQKNKLISDHPDYKAVHGAILDYVEALYLVDSTLIEKSVHPDLHKRGYWFNGNSKKYHDNLDMTFEELRNLSAKWNKKGTAVNEASPKEITIYDITYKTASAKLVAEWGMDYFHLAKIDGKWMIMNVLWQSIPEK